MNQHKAITTTTINTTRHPAALLFLLLLLASVPGQIVQSFNRGRSNQENGVCLHSSTELIPHPTACQRYYDCSDNSEPYGHFWKYEKECYYPDLFDVNLKKCVGFEKAECGAGRIAAKGRCEYYNLNSCIESCGRCNVDNPSCDGKTDGLWPNPSKLWSPYFTTCKSERSVNWEESCNVDGITGESMIFSPEKRTCVPVWQVPIKGYGFQTSCDGKTQGFYQLNEKWESRVHFAYRCPDGAKFFCKTPFNVHHDISKCVALK